MTDLQLICVFCFLKSRKKVHHYYLINKISIQFYHHNIISQLFSICEICLYNDNCCLDFPNIINVIIIKLKNMSYLSYYIYLLQMFLSFFNPRKRGIKLIFMSRNTKPHEISDVLIKQQYIFRLS